MKGKIINIPFLQYKTHAVIYGDIKKNTPIILLHGGPGGCSEKYESLSRLADHNIPIIFYDQFGCGYSKISNYSNDLFTVDTYMDELENLISYLKIEKYYLLGHSWGGMLALSFVTKREHKGLEKLILFSTLPSTKIWNEEHLEMIKDFPSNEKVAMINAYENKPFNKEDYDLGIKRFSKEHVGKKSDRKYICKRKRFPKLFFPVYNYMWGPNELFGTGTLVNYNVEDDLSKIDVPTLIMSGKLDESSPKMNKLMNERIKGSKWVLFEYSHHCAYNEEPDEVLNEIISFIK